MGKKQLQFCGEENKKAGVYNNGL